MNEVIPHELQGVFNVHMTDVTQPRVQSPKAINTQVVQASVRSSHASEDRQSDKQRLFTVEDSDLIIERSIEESGTVDGAGMSQEDLFDGMICVRIGLQSMANGNREYNP